MIYNNKLLSIREWQSGDESYLALNANNKNISDFMPFKFPYPYTYDDAVYWIELNRNKHHPDNFAILYDNEPVGNIGFVKNTEKNQNTGNITIWIGEEYWGREIAFEAVTFFTGYCFNTFGVKKIFAKVFSNNKRAISLFERAGFKIEKVLKNNIVKNGNTFDELIFAFSQAQL
jgi:RimJ/RimL family protein N-acetyltransferase